MKKQITELFKKIISDKKECDNLFLTSIISVNKGLSIFEGKLDAVHISEKAKIGIMVSKNSRWSTALVENISYDAVKLAISNAIQTTQYNDPEPDLSLAPKTDASKFKPYPLDEKIAAMSLKEIEAKGMEVYHLAKSYSPKITNLPHLGCGTEFETRIIANSEGVFVTEDRAMLRASLSAMATGLDGRTVNGGETLNFPHVSEFDANYLVKRACDETLMRLEPRGLKNGVYTVLLDPANSYHLFESFLSAFTGDLLYRKLSKLEGKLNTQIASPLLSLRDCGTEGLTPHHFDAEGTPVVDKWLIKDGVLQNFLHNRFTAKKCGTASTGNASDGFGAPCSVGHANLMIEGKITPFSSMTNNFTGLLVKELNGASFSPISGDFSFGALGHWLVNGKFDHTLADFTLAGNFFDVIKNIQAIGDDVELLSPSLLGSVLARSLLVENLTVSGL